MQTSNDPPAAQSSSGAGQETPLAGQKRLSHQAALPSNPAPAATSDQPLPNATNSPSNNETATNSPPGNGAKKKNANESNMHDPIALD